jgi:adenine deaminase
MIALSDDAYQFRRRTGAAWGSEVPDLVVSGATVLLPTGELQQLDIAVVGQRIAAVARDLVVSGVRRIDATGKIIVPGYVEPHAHIFGPYSAGTYIGEAIARGITCLVADDAYMYSLLDADVYPRLLDLSAGIPAVLRWSLRPEPWPRRLHRDEAIRLLSRKDVGQVGEVATYPELREMDEELVRMLVGARVAGVRVEGHNPGASARTLGVAAAAGVTADHEAITGADVATRLRLGMWAFLRHNGLRPDVPDIIRSLLELGVPLERTAFTVDGGTPGWIQEHGLIDAAIAAAIGAGLGPVEAYAMASWRPASYVGLDAHVGVIAPGRLASFNILGALSEPRPELVLSAGVPVARDGRMIEPVPDVPWETLRVEPWSVRRERLDPDEFRLRPDDPAVFLESQAILRAGSGAGSGLVCAVFDPVHERMIRARIFGLAGGWRGLVSTLTPERLMVAIGSDPVALKHCVDSIFDAGGGIAFSGPDGVDVLALPVGGAITAAPFSEISAFYARLQRYARSIGCAYDEPATTLMFIADDGLPGVRLLSRGLVDVRTREVLKATTPARWVEP